VLQLRQVNCISAAISRRVDTELYIDIQHAASTAPCKLLICFSFILSLCNQFIWELHYFVQSPTIWKHL